MRIVVPLLGVAALVIGLAAVLLHGTPSVASDAPTATMKYLVNAAPAGDCNQNTNQQVWDVDGVVRVTNTSSTDITFSSTDFTATVTDPNGTSDVPVDVIDADGFHAGQTLAMGATEKYDVDVHVTLPCDAMRGDVTAHLMLEGSDQEITSTALFECGTQIPLGTVGVLGLTVLLGLGLAVVQRRRTRKARAAGSGA